MVRFLCFFTPINSHKPKKVAQRSAVTMNLSPQEISQDQVRKASFCSNNDLSSTSVEQVTTPSSHEGFCKSEDLYGNTCPDDGKDFPRMVHLKKSQSLGSILDKRRGFSGDDVTEDDEMDQEFSFDYSHENNMKGLDDSFVNNVASAEVDDLRITGANTNNQCHNNEVTDFFDLITDPVHHESIFSIGVLNEFDGKQQDVGKNNSNEPSLDYTHLSSNNLVTFAKSRSETNLRVDSTNSIEGSPTHELTGLRSRSFEGLCSLRGGRNGSVNGDGTLCSDMALERHIAAQYDHDTTEASDLDGRGSHCHADLREECLLSNANSGFDDLADQGRAEKYSSRKLEWIKPDIDGVGIKHNLLQDCSIQKWDELTSNEFNTKRIEQWISQIDIQNDTTVEEVGESSYSTHRKGHQVVAGLTNPKLGANSLGMEVAYNYISSLSPTSSSAQMSNLGLVAVPFLSAFIGLRVLNLSGNAIVRITAGALPRGLHMLNLSKNNISAIEGLRDLTRLRVLNLSYNRIVRIGHGLACCCCLKELYLAGNKISEVEGLHRLLKLNVLDLRLNKISTSKGLGQLAANYSSLQAMNLEGNPAQRNVGDEQLKKYLLSLLPHLLYYNKQSIIRPSAKEISDHRPPRSMAAASHPFNRGTRTDQRTGSAVVHRPSSSRPSYAVLLKQTKSHRHVRLPPAGSVKPSASEPGNPMRRCLSEGTL